MKGKLVLSSYYDKNNHTGAVVNIARGNMNGIINRCFNLAPSAELFKWYLDNKDVDGWFSDYKKVYLNQLKDNKSALRELSIIREMLEGGDDVTLLCFCKDFKLCHRYIVGGLFEKKGFEVIYK